MKKEILKLLLPMNLSSVELAKLHKRCFPDKPYSEQTMKYFLDNDKYVILSGKFSLAITLIFQEISEIITIAVDPSYRKNGLGSKLLSQIVQIAKNKGSKKIFLEVSSQNQVAIRMYKNAGFKTIYVRKNYYSLVDKTLCDALVMALKLDNRAKYS